MNTRIEKAFFTFGSDEVETERGNTWLYSEDRRQHVIWIEGKKRGEKNAYLEISIVLDNYPGLRVTVIESTEDALRDHIHNKCSGWDVRRCNIKGVNITDDKMVVDSNVEDEDSEDDEGDGL